MKFSTIAKFILNSWQQSFLFSILIFMCQRKENLNKTWNANLPLVRKKNANSFCICADIVNIEIFLDKQQITQELWIIHMPNFI